MLYLGPCYLARCDLITERVWIHVKYIHCVINAEYKKKKRNNFLININIQKKKLIFPVNNIVPIYAMYTMRHKPYTKRIVHYDSGKLSKQNVPHKLSHALIKER